MRTAAMKRLLSIAGLLLAAALAPAHAQEKFPSRPIQMLIPLAAGTSADFVYRPVAERLSQKLGQQVVIQNRPGASGTIASDTLLKSAPDGYTILYVNSLHTANPALLPKLPYDTLRDFAGLAMVAESPTIIVVYPGTGVRTVKELIALAKRQPGKINYGTSGVGTTTHLAGAYFAARAGIDMVAVPYKGVELLADLVAGRIEVFVAPIPALMPFIRDGKLIPLAITSRTPMKTPLELQTVETAAGLPGYEYTNIAGFVVPAKVPRPIVEMLSREIRAAAQDKADQEKRLTLGVFPRDMGPEEFDAFIRSDMERTAELVKSLGIKAN